MSELAFIEIQSHPLGIAIRIPVSVAESADPVILPLPSALRDAVINALSPLDIEAERHES